MQALVTTGHGRPSVLKLMSQPNPAPGPGQVRVAVRAAGVNFADVIARMGFYPQAPNPPCVLGYEFAGEVESIGAQVTEFAPGDLVMGACRFGGYAELAVAKQADLMALPEDWTFEQGAAFPVNYAAAYAALIRYGGLRPGERVLIHSAGGGVGLAAVQLAQSMSTEIFGAASPGKHDVIRALGVDHPIDYRRPDFADAIRRVAGEAQPLDLVIDGVGGQSLRNSYSLLRPGGRLVCLGISAAVGGERRNPLRLLKAVAQTPWFNALRLTLQSKSVIGIDLGRIWDSKGSLDELVGPLADLVRDGRVQPSVSYALPLDAGAKAHTLLQRRQNVGKVVLQV
jgi:NADPH:quinone reductase-like Zn-dependent oxidoreductase